MNAPAVFFLVRWLAWDTFYQSLASRSFWLMLAASGVCILLCLSVRIEGGESLRPPEEIELYGKEKQPLTGPPKVGTLSVAFGAIRLSLFRDAEAAVHFLQARLAIWVAGAVGTILLLMWTAGFLPQFLQPSAASVMFAKPAPRWALLIGKFTGVLALVGFQAMVFIAGTWAALGLATGHWPAAYLLCIPALLIHFAILYSFSVLIAVYTRNTIACIFGSVLFWLVCYGLNHARHFAVALPSMDPSVPPYPGFFLGTVALGYWIMPKPADLVLLLNQALQTGEHFQLPAEFETVQKMGAFHPGLSVLTSLLASAALLAFAAWQLEKTDY